ncbi:cysteine hydrolase family protein [Amycolatopsis sp. GM8]|uniref:cysteine hydrolase family protein n=1 Tax=Amycolatopsis sp. GM8 TaxID=2896530 RepID=UPI001F4629F9|nr:cysteine hydrolase [Amycolatopsis sp. GM8]
MTDLRARQLDHLRGRRPALLVVDVQRSFAGPGFEDAISVMARLVDTARDRDVPVVWIELASDPANPWRASAWFRGGDADAPFGPDEPCVLGTPGAEWYRLAPAAGEPRVAKRGYSGFLGTDLENLLRAREIEWVAVAGLTTECCVTATATDAFQLGWPVLVPADAVAAHDPAVHENALGQLALNVAVLSSAEELAGIWPVP